MSHNKAKARVVGSLLAFSIYTSYATNISSTFQALPQDTITKDSLQKYYKEVVKILENNHNIHRATIYPKSSKPEKEAILSITSVQIANFLLPFGDGELRISVEKYTLRDGSQ